MIAGKLNITKLCYFSRTTTSKIAIIVIAVFYLPMILDYGTKKNKYVYVSNYLKPGNVFISHNFLQLDVTRNHTNNRPLPPATDESGNNQASDREYGDLNNSSPLEWEVFGPVDSKNTYFWTNKLKTSGKWRKKCNNLLGSSLNYEDEIKRNHSVSINWLHIHQEEIYSITPEQFRSRSVENEDQITLTTQLTENRWEALKRTIYYWQQPIVAVVEISKRDSSSWLLTNLKEDLATSLKADEERWICLIFVVKAAPTAIYPVNWMRNLAQVNVHSKFIFHVDGDFIPSKNLALVLQKQLAKLPVSEQNTALIVPAFESDGKRFPKYVAEQNVTWPESKQELLNFMKASAVHPFHKKGCGQRLTDYSRWQSSTKEQYNLTIKHDQCFHCYEPYFVVKTAQSPFFPEILMQRYFNKQAGFSQLCHNRYHFQVITEGFLLHAYHKSAQGQRVRKLFECVKSTWITYAKHFGGKTMFRQ